MGANSSKTSLERRNTITRRSQRRSIHSIRSRVDKVFTEVKRFDGVEEDEKFRRYVIQIDRLRNELFKKQRDLQPQVKSYFQTTLNRLDDAEEALEDQLEDNREYSKERQEELQERARLRQEMLEEPKIAEKKKDYDGGTERMRIFGRKKEKSKEESDDDEDEVEPNSISNRKTKSQDELDVESDREFEAKYTRRSTKQQVDSEEGTDEEQVPHIPKKNNKNQDDSEEETDRERLRKNKKNGKVKQVYDNIDIEEENNATEVNSLAKTTSKRKTVELSFVKIIPEESNQPEEQTKTEKKVKSPDQKRKSILKMGIPVMPAAMMNFITKKSKKMSAKYSDDKSENNSDEIVERVNTIINELQTIECQVADFVGKKYGTQYNRIRDKLNHYLVELCQMKTCDEFALEQIKLCRNYVSSCMNFLDEKAVEDRKQEYQDDVFLPGSGSRSRRPTSPTARATSPGSRATSPVQVQDQLQKLSKTTAI